MERGPASIGVEARRSCPSIGRQAHGSQENIAFSAPGRPWLKHLSSVSESKINRPAKSCGRIPGI
jgi:hypothetical protein